MLQALLLVASSAAIIRIEQTMNITRNQKFLRIKQFKVVNK